MRLDHGGVADEPRDVVVRAGTLVLLLSFEQPRLGVFDGSFLHGSPHVYQYDIRRGTTRAGTGTDDARGARGERHLQGLRGLLEGVDHRSSADTTRTRRTWRAGFHHAWASAPEMDASYLQELRLRAFKSFTDAVLPLDELTLLVERDQLVAGTAIDRVDVWTAEGEISFR